MRARAVELADADELERAADPQVLIGARATSSKAEPDIVRMPTPKRR
jgi:hypothetical protein